ncbi:hypothetical protein HHI36_000993 [Cryptolaemus montrouzieri]|uniref:Uncharacterized protein n=1 Tax=Cryptolaemus montrouzieri TaxID=559131 RepID=A0ABD2P707_9CUCU
MSGSCFKCGLTCAFKESKIELFGFPCDFIRRNCASQFSSEIRVLVIASRTLPFCCPECRKNINDITALIRRVSDLEVLVQNNSSNVSGAMIALEQRILKLEMGKEEVKTPNVNYINMNGEKFEEIITEILERQKRENNIILANINAPTYK